jgi:hypothetical protein
MKRLSPPKPPVALANDDTAPEPLEVAVLLAVALPPAPPPLACWSKKPPLPPAPPMAVALLATGLKLMFFAVLVAFALPPAPPLPPPEPPAPPEELASASAEPEMTVVADVAFAAPPFPPFPEIGSGTNSTLFPPAPPFPPVAVAEFNASLFGTE